MYLIKTNKQRNKTPQTVQVKIIITTTWVGFGGEEVDLIKTNYILS